MSNLPRQRSTNQWIALLRHILDDGSRTFRASALILCSYVGLLPVPADHRAVVVIGVLGGGQAITRWRVHHQPGSRRDQTIQ